MTATSDARISPVFRYRDAAAAIGWLERAYGFTTHERHDGPDGSVVHAELRLGPAAIGISSAGPVDPSNPWTTVRSGIYVCLPQVDPLHDRAAAAGAAIVQPLNDTSYGAREFSARDIGDHLWSFGTYGMAATGEAPSLFVCLHYTQGPQAIEWLSRAFAFEPLLVVPGADGVIDHAELTLGRDVLMLSSSPREGSLWGDDRQCVNVAVADPDAHYERACAASATVVKAPHDTPYGARAYYTRDCDDFLWGFSTYRPELKK